MTTPPTTPGRKSAVTPESLHAAALQLIDAGQPVTGARIRAVIGSGSMTTINNLLREWRNQHQPQVMPAGGITSIEQAIEDDDTLLPAACKAGIASIAKALNDCLPALTRGIAEAVAAERHVSRLSALDTEARLAAAEEDLAHTSAEAEQLAEQLAHSERCVTEVRACLRNSEDERKAQAEQIASQTAELETQRQQIASQTASLDAAQAQIQAQAERIAQTEKALDAAVADVATLKKMLADQEMLENMLREDMAKWKAIAEKATADVQAKAAKRPTKAKQLDIETAIKSKVAGTETPK